MTCPVSGAIKLTRDIGAELDESAGAEIGLEAASRGTYATINTNNDAADRPDGNTPHQMSEFYSYDHSATAALSGDYGNSAAGTKLFSSSSVPLQTYTEDLSHSDYAGSSVIGETGHIYFRMESTNSYRQDAQLYQVDFDGGGYHTVGTPFDTTYGYPQWKTTSQTTNATYNHGATWTQVTSGTTGGKWNYDTYGTGSSQTGIDVGSTGCIYYEGSGSSAYNKDVYLRLKEMTFTTNTFISRWYHYGGNFQNPARVWMGVYIT